MQFMLKTRKLEQAAELGLDWEESPCPLCESENWTPVLQARDPLPGADGLQFLVVRCQDCTLTFTNPRPSVQAMQQFYPSNYVCYQTKAVRPKRRDPYADLLAPFGLGRLLDFGCGSSNFLLRMRERGWRVAGIDYSADVVERLRRDHQLDAYVGSLPNPRLTDHSFEMITMFQSLEHVHRPLEVLRAAWRLLAPGGKVLIAVPNFDSLPARWFGTSWYGLDVPRHLTHFTPWTLRLMLNRAGFLTDTLRMVRHAGWIRHSVETARRQSAGLTVSQRLLHTRLGSGLAAWYSCLTSQSDCIVAVATRT